MSKRVLVVDDSQAMRNMIMASVEDCGDFEVVEAANGFEALKLLPREKFDLVITDINMPTINGLEIIHFIKSSAHYQNIPIIIVTTENARQDQEKGIALGAKAYITKPFNPEELKKVVVNLVAL